MANEPTSENSAVSAMVEPAATAQLGLANISLKVTDNPEKFGALAEAFAFVEERRIYDLIASARGLAIKVAIVLSLPIIAYSAYYVSPIGPGILSGGLVLGIVKIVTIYAFSALIVALLVIWRYGKSIIYYLEMAEEYAQLGRDITALYMPVYREQLKELNEKLVRHGQEPVGPNGVDLAKELMPFVTLFLKKEKSILKWGLTGLKLYKTISKFFKGNDSSGKKRETSI